MLVTERLRLREWREADKPLLAEIHSDPEVMRFLGGVKTFDETSEVIDLIGGILRRRRVADLQNHAREGTAGLDPQRTFAPDFCIGEAVDRPRYERRCRNLELCTVRVWWDTDLWLRWLA